MWFRYVDGEQIESRMIDADCSDCDSNDLCLGKTVSWSSNTQWIYAKALPDFIKATSKYDSTR